QPLRVTVEALRADRRAVARVPPAVVAAHQPVIVRVPVQRIADQQVEPQAGSAGGDTEPREERVHLVHLGSERVGDAAVGDVLAAAFCTFASAAASPPPASPTSW